jgi:biopolymer transport protein TolQ
MPSPVLAQMVGGAIPTSPVEMVLHSSPVTKVVLVILAVLSLVSWSIMFVKWLEFARVRRASRSFTSEFERAARLEQAAGLARRARPSPYTRVFGRAMEFVSQTKATGPQRITETQSLGMANALSASQVEALRLLLDAETASERDHLARFIPSLATIGSVSPLIGLLGTVLGVIQSFIGIATKGSGNIGAVAPGVAEALIATAAALAVAIPAVFGYNLFANRVNRLETELEGFGSEVIALMAREGRL